MVVEGVVGCGQDRHPERIEAMKLGPGSPNRQRVNRREFLRTTAKAISAVGLSALDVSRFAHAAGTDRIRVGMIGCGGRNTGAAAEALRADRGAVLVAMADIFMERIQAAREVIAKELRREGRGDQLQVPDDHCFTGFGGFRHVIELSDVVLIANAAKFHPLHAYEALRAGRHVFVEKPHGIDPYGVKLMREAARLAQEKGLCLVSGLQSRYHPGYAETIERIHDGAIGEIRYIEENFLRAPYGVVQRPAGMDELRWQLYTQYHFVWLSGDDVPQSLVHNLDRSRWVLKEAVPLRCHGMGGRSTSIEPIYGNVFDHHAVVYEFPNDVRVYAFCRTITGCYNDYSSKVFGTRGMADIMACRIVGETNWEWKGSANPYQIEHDRLFRAIRTGTPINNGDYMWKSTLTAVMGQLSCYTGLEVTWEQVMQSDFYYPPKPEECRDDMEPPVKPGPDGTYPVYTPGRTRLL